MWPFNRPKQITGLRGDDQVELSNGQTASLDDIIATLEQIQKDQAIFNTAINRIERKQNRWLDILNTGEDKVEASIVTHEPGNPKTVALPPTDNTPACGEELEL